MRELYHVFFNVCSQGRGTVAACGLHHTLKINHKFVHTYCFNILLGPQVINHCSISKYQIWSNFQSHQQVSHIKSKVNSIKEYATDSVSLTAEEIIEFLRLLFLFFQFFHSYLLPPVIMLSLKIIYRETLYLSGHIAPYKLRYKYVCYLTLYLIHITLHISIGREYHLTPRQSLSIWSFYTIENRSKRGSRDSIIRMDPSLHYIDRYHRNNRLTHMINFNIAIKGLQRKNLAKIYCKWWIVCFEPPNEDINFPRKLIWEIVQSWSIFVIW